MSYYSMTPNSGYFLLLISGLVLIRKIPLFGIIFLDISNNKLSQNNIKTNILLQKENGYKDGLAGNHN